MWLEKQVKTNQEVMYQTIKILPIELASDLNFVNYFYKFGAYMFIMDQTRCDELQNTFKK